MPNYKRTKLACYSANVTMASVFALPPLLFVTFNDMYGVSYTLLGTLVLVNFRTQLTIDLILSFFSKYFNEKLMVRVMPIITSVGLVIYALSPVLFPNSIFAGLMIGTIIFSVSAGLSEVLISPVIAALPSDNPGRDMSFLHSLYGIGVFSVIRDKHRILQALRERELDLSGAFLRRITDICRCTLYDLTDAGYDSFGGIKER